MIQFLSSLIEWLALAALSSVGIEVEAVDCAAVGPAEYRTLSAVYVTGQDYVFQSAGYNTTSLSDCADAAGSLFRIDETPLLVSEPPHSYRS